MGCFHLTIHVSQLLAVRADVPPRRSPHRPTTGARELTRVTFDAMRRARGPQVSQLRDDVCLTPGIAYSTQLRRSHVVKDSEDAGGTRQRNA